MEHARQERAPTFGQEVDGLFLRLIEAQASYAEYKRELLKLEKRWLQKVRTPAQRLLIQRNITKTILTEAFAFNMGWKEFGPLLRRLQRLGFRDLGMRVHVTCLYVQSLDLFPERAREAWDMLDDTERKALRLRREHPLRREYLESINHAKKVARVPRPPSR
ncbi:hypothetical protein JRI60_41565 [Archangium violaceum]|uniref:hypothetical protein n=1 Tax=Archangium violaceum TaxID=83451 RepID=UPI0019503861|nr:hypothetical protein [Archangium violaceum]QRN95491.1 hypothetical protein JRI60_41565 [Archangium violaceum]